VGVVDLIEPGSTIVAEVEAFILAGGASRRMGTNKALLRIGDETFVERLAETLNTLAPKVSSVGQRFTFPNLNYVSDIVPGWGALGGLQAALATSSAEWSLVVACDLPFVTTELIAFLMSKREQFAAVVPRQPDNRPQPLCALYRTVACREKAAELVRSGFRRPLDLLEAIQTRYVPFSELEQLDHSSKFFVNINTPEDYYEATRGLPGL
jgi:molybdopterin-guanine dinucleotide biosynthesis protein A